MPNRCTEIAMIPTLYEPRNYPAYYIENQSQFDIFSNEFSRRECLPHQHVPQYTVTSDIPVNLPHHEKPSIAIDTERARGKEYQAHVELLQLKMDDNPIVLIDAQNISGMDSLAYPLSQYTWIAHAAEADLLALHKLGLHCTDLFDTELAGRFLGYSHVNLATMTRECLGINLDKGKGGEDWSLRPLEPEFLLYAAMDVELLAELADVLQAKLVQSGKLAWFREECRHIVQNISPIKRKFNWKKITKNRSTTDPRFKQAFMFIWNIREYIAHNLNIFPQSLASDETLLDWTTLHHEIQWRKMDQIELTQLALPGPLEEKIAAALPLDEKFWHEITQSSPVVGPCFIENLALIQERKKIITTVIQDIAQRYTLDPIVLSSRAFSITLAKDITLRTQEEIQQLMEISGSRSWQMTILANPLAEALISLA